MLRTPRFATCYPSAKRTRDFFQEAFVAQGIVAVGRATDLVNQARFQLIAE